MYIAKPADAAAPATGVPGAPPSQWSSGLCDCCDDCGVCCLTCWCPCITFGRIAETVDRGAPSCGTSGALYALLGALTGWACQWVYSCSYRRKMRAQFRLADAPCCDCCVHLCCEPCALCQEYKELRARGLDPSLGWQLAQQQQSGLASYPPATQQMGRSTTVVNQIVVS